MDWTIHINNLIYWADEKGYHVTLENNGDDSICYISKIIEINSSMPQKIQLVRLLHECGHVLIFENGSSYKFERKRDLPESSPKFKVFTVIEEVEAWKRGKELAKRLNIPIDDEEWESSMVKAIKKYINWAADLKEGADESKSSKARRKGRNSKESTS